MDSLRDKTAVITGASSGMGLAVAHAFAHRGANLASGARREGPLAQAARECEARGVGAVWVHADVTNAEVGLCSPRPAQPCNSHGFRSVANPVCLSMTSLRLSSPTILASRIRSER
jgi:NAD(P)-dependent dehydrogenase (short-subunit alcohol dehydrogenase family)